MVLEDDYPCLPPVLVADAPPPPDTPHPCLVPPQDLASALKLRAHKLDHLDLHLDWCPPPLPLPASLSYLLSDGAMNEAIRGHQRLLFRHTVHMP